MMQAQTLWSSTGVPPNAYQHSTTRKKLDRITPANRVERKPASKQQSSLAGKITEIVVQDHSLTSAPILLPLLAHLSGDQRWLTWVAPQMDLPRTLLKDAGINLNKMLVLNSETSKKQLRLACKALEAGTSHAVAFWPQSSLSSDDMNTLEEAAKCGQCHCIVIRQRND